MLSVLQDTREIKCITSSDIVLDIGSGDGSLFPSLLVLPFLTNQRNTVCYENKICGCVLLVSLFFALFFVQVVFQAGNVAFVCLFVCSFFAWERVNLPLGQTYT